ncbi:glycosyltransferase family 2 protein [Nocardioides sp.]|uniref:glycosyltransferase family 2 protein n=1 Tax=Nocardioides sp. TaxID=35761 RepID=UPI002ED5CA48
MTQLLDRNGFTYSIVIPVFNSEPIVGDTIDRVVDVFTEAGLRYELILVNDGSQDRSWQVISERAARLPNVVALNLMRNYGQHYANLAGLTEATGDYVITMDDDLQNPPDQALVLIDAAMAGHEVVFGQFVQKQAGGLRRLGSKLIGIMNSRIFGKPADLVVSNFRILRRDVVDRIVASRTTFPYITGQALMFSGDRANVVVRHDPRPVGKSTYSLVRIMRLVLTILFSYSSWPLRAGAALGFAIAGLSFLLGGVLVIRGLVRDSVVPGWTSTMVLVSLFAGFIIALISMIGEYVVRTLQTVSTEEAFHVVQRVRQ